MDTVFIFAPISSVVLFSILYSLFIADVEDETFKQVLASALAGIFVVAILLIIGLQPQVASPIPHTMYTIKGERPVGAPPTPPF